MLYVPTVMLYFVGVSVFVLGPGHAALADNKTFAMVASVALLALCSPSSISSAWASANGSTIWARIGTWIAAAVLIGLGITIWSRFGTTITAADFRIPADPVRPQFLRRDLFRPGWTRTCLRHGRRNPRSPENASRRGRLGRRDLRRCSTSALPSRSWSPSAKTTSAYCRESCRQSATWRAKLVWRGSSRPSRSC